MSLENRSIPEMIVVCFAFFYCFSPWLFPSLLETRFCLEHSVSIISQSPLSPHLNGNSSIVLFVYFVSLSV